MNKFKSHFAFNRSQQNGIFLLVLIIIVLQLFYFFYPFSSKVEDNEEQQELVTRLQRSVDSLKQVQSRKDSVSITPYNPNFISDYKGYRIGMSIEEIDRLHAHRARDLWVNSAEEFQQVTKVSDSLLAEISPFFRFPEWKTATSEKRELPKKAFSTALVKADLNSATAEDLQQVNGIGEKLSARIVNYRESLGGFRGGIQLKDVYGLSPEVVERALQRFEVENFPFEKLNINSATVVQLSEIPYLNYEIARAVVNLRKEVGNISSFEALSQIKGFPADKIDRIKLYLAIDHEN